MWLGSIMRKDVVEGLGATWACGSCHLRAVHQVTPLTQYPLFPSSPCSQTPSPSDAEISPLVSQFLLLKFVFLDANTSRNGN